MKKIVTTLALIITLAMGGFVFTGCGAKQESDKVLIYTSFYPLYDFATKVGGDKVEVINLVKPGEEAHSFEPSTQQMVGMEMADLIFINGLGMEHWVTELGQNIVSKVVDTSLGIATIEATTNQSEPHDDHEHENADPHLWTSIRNSKKQMENIKNALMQKDPLHATYYQTNYTRYAFMFDGLDSQYTAVLANASTNHLVVAHRAFGYLAHDYNLVQYALTGVESTSEPDAQTLATIIDFINQNNIKAVFYQEMANPQVAQTIVSQTNAVLYPLSTLESLSQHDIDMGEDYLSVMARNLVYLQQGLA